MGSSLRCQLILATLAIWLLAVGAADAQFSISGTVVDELASPVQDVDVFLFDDLGNPIGIPQVRTNSAGFYIGSGLPPATYGLEFQPPGGTQFIPVMQTGIVERGSKADPRSGSENPTKED